MVSSETLALFFLSSCALGLAPGPDNLFVLTQSAVHGRVRGLMVVAGLCTGLLFHTTAVALGVAAVFQASTTAFTVLKVVGAAYLAYLAFRAFQAGAVASEGEAPALLPLSKLYLRGIIMNVTNPKVGIFFLAFLPQFVDAGSGPVSLQMIVLGCVFIVATLLVFGVIAWCAGFAGERLRSSTRVQVWINRLAGTIFLALAARLVVTENSP